MARSEKQKQKLLYLAEYLRQNTDEDHYVTTAEMIDYLEANGIAAERKSIYTDIEALREYGMDIIRPQGVRGGYMLASREFELAEVKLLVDLVQSSKFITTRKSRELIAKLGELVSRHNASALRRQVVVADRNKTSNENIYYTVDVIYEAIARNVKIRYHYFEWNEKKERHLRKGGAFYEVSPWLLTWDDENYYLIAYDQENGIMKHYRVDKMLHPSLSEQTREGREIFEAMDVASISKKTFGMFAGEERTVRLRVDRRLTGVIVDRFGTDVSMRLMDEEHLSVRVEIAVSPQFFGWISGFGTGMEIIGPEDVRSQFAEYISGISQLYHEQTERKEKV